jgi:alpha-beta hydrolase superfamily lysophospholipase
MRMYPIVETPELAREAFFSADMPQEQLQGYFKRLQNDSYLAFIDMLILDLPKTKRVTTPILVLGAENDTIFSQKQHESTARAYNTQAEIILNIAHDIMLEANWRVVADRILTWLTEQDQ